MITATEQERARCAYQCAETGSMLTRKKEYKSYVRKIPMLVKTNGLAATFAFIRSKADKEQEKAGYAYKMIYEQISVWLRGQGYLPTAEKELAYELVGLDSATYRVVTGEVLAFFTWLRRFAEALIEGEADEN